MNKSGCRIVAQAKLLKETGIAGSGFDPDVYGEWARTNGYFGLSNKSLANAILENQSGKKTQGTAPVGYAATQGKALFYKGEVKLPSNKSEQCEKIMEWLNSGYYVIIGDTGHHVYVAREKSLSAGTPYLANSGSGYATEKECKNWCLQNYATRNKKFSVARLYSLDGTISADVYTENAERVSDTEYTLHGTVSSPGYVASEIGMYFGDSSDNLTKLGSDKPKGSSPSMWYNTKKYLKRDLTPGTTYYYRAYAIVEGQTFWGETRSFTTPGNTPGKNEPAKTSGAPVADGVYTLTPKCASSARLDVDNGGKANKTNIQIYKANGTASQKFKLTYLNNGYYTITAQVSGKLLDVANGKKESKTNVWVFTKNKTDAQKWKLTPA